MKKKNILLLNLIQTNLHLTAEIKYEFIILVFTWLAE